VLRTGLVVATDPYPVRDDAADFDRHARAIAQAGDYPTSVDGPVRPRLALARALVFLPVVFIDSLMGFRAPIDLFLLMLAGSPTDLAGRQRSRRPRP